MDVNINVKHFIVHDRFVAGTVLPVLPVIRSPLFSPEYPAAFFRDFLRPQSLL